MTENPAPGAAQRTGSRRAAREDGSGRARRAAAPGQPAGRRHTGNPTLRLDGRRRRSAATVTRSASRPTAPAAAGTGRPAVRRPRTRRAHAGPATPGRVPVPPARAVRPVTSRPARYGQQSAVQPASARTRPAASVGPPAAAGRSASGPAFEQPGQRPQAQGRFGVGTLVASILAAGLSAAEWRRSVPAISSATGDSAPP